MTSRERVEDIEQLVSRSGAGPDDSALRTIRAHVFALRAEITGGPARAKLAGIESWVDIYFSYRKHQKYPGGGDQVATWILADCKVVKDSL